MAVLRNPKGSTVLVFGEGAKASWSMLCCAILLDYVDAVISFYVIDKLFMYILDILG